MAVIIPVLNGARYLPGLLQALAAGDDQPEEILVVDDGSSDSSRDIAQAAGCRVVRSTAGVSLHGDRSQTASASQSRRPAFPQHAGPAVGRNAGALHAHSDVLLFLDADVLPHPDVVDRVRAAFAADPALDAVFGSYDDRPTEPDFLSQYRNLFHHYVHQQGSETASTFWTGCGAMRREVFLKLGGFTDDYGRPCIEDIELGYRLNRRGGKIRLDKALLVTHRKRWTVANMLRTDIFDRGIPWAELILRHRAFVNDLNLQTRNRASVALTWLLLFSLGASAALGDARVLWLSAALAATLLLMNWRLYAWFARKRGWRFAAQAIAWHWLYYGYNAIAFGVGALKHLRSAFARGQLHPDRPGALVEFRIER